MAGTTDVSGGNMPGWHGNGKKGNAKTDNMKGKPNKKFTRHELTQLDMAEAEYKTRRHREQDPRPYKGSEDEMEHRLRMRLPKNK
jgi:hypothetical protein